MQTRKRIVRDEHEENLELHHHCPESNCSHLCPIANLSRDEQQVQARTRYCRTTPFVKKSKCYQIVLKYRGFILFLNWLIHTPCWCCFHPLGWDRAASFHDCTLW